MAYEHRKRQLMMEIRIVLEVGLRHDDQTAANGGGWEIDTKLKNGLSAVCLWLLSWFHNIENIVLKPLADKLKWSI